MPIEKITLILFLILTAAVFAGCSGREEPGLGNPDNLELRVSFGMEGEEILTHPQKIVTNGRNAIYISDQLSSRILEYNLQGEFQQIIGSEGRGPGEFRYPLALETDGQRLYVQDDNLRLVSFKLDDLGSDIINQDRSFIEFEINEGIFYGFTPPPGTDAFRAPISGLEEQLIRVYDSEWNLVNTFGEYLQMEENMPPLISWPLLEIEGDIVHVAFEYFPIYRAYTTDGELITEVDLSQQLVSIENPEENVRSNYNPDSQGRVEMTKVFMAMDTYRERIFLCRLETGLVIEEYRFSENSLTYQTTYTYDNLPENYNALDFFYHPESNSFYVIEYQDWVPMVSVYRLAEGE